MRIGFTAALITTAITIAALGAVVNQFTTGVVV